MLCDLSVAMKVDDIQLSSVSSAIKVCYLSFVCRLVYCDNNVIQYLHSFNQYAAQWLTSLSWKFCHKIWSGSYGVGGSQVGLGGCKLRFIKCLKWPWMVKRNFLHVSCTDLPVLNFCAVDYTFSIEPNLNIFIFILLLFTLFPIYWCLIMSVCMRVYSIQTRNS